MNSMLGFGFLQSLGFFLFWMHDAFTSGFYNYRNVTPNLLRYRCVLQSSVLASLVFPWALQAIVIPVEMSLNRLSPQNINVNVGDTVMWVSRADHATTDTESYAGEWKSEPLSTGSSFAYTFSRAGEYVYRSRTYLGSAAFGTAGTVNVLPGSNSVPMAMILTPVNGFYFTELQPIPISASVASPKSGIEKVEFFAGDQSLGVVTNAPYDLAFSNAGPGNYALTAHLTDKEGMVVISQPVEITIDPRGVSRFSSFRQLPQGQFFSNYNVPIGLSHCVQRSEDLITWESIFSTSSGAGTFVDDTVTNVVQRFYRIQHCP
jgi:plastocyanin